MIPATFHRIWIGEAIPEQFECYWRRFAELHLSWSLKTWRLEDLDWLANRDYFEQAANPAQKADIARYEILLRHGGVYVDCDVEPLRGWDPLLEHMAFAGYEDDIYVNNAVIGAEPEHPLLQAIVETELPTSMWTHRSHDINAQSGPPFLTEVLRHTEWDITLYPRSAFYPYGYWEQDPGVYPEGSYGVHHWAKSWL